MYSLIVSVLFSEPKIPQLMTKACFATYAKKFQCSSASRKFLNTSSRNRSGSRNSVSVLFSEPKIPQSAYNPAIVHRIDGFSALQRAENSSIKQENRDLAL